MGIPMLKIRRSRDHLICNMWILILVRHLYIETAPPWFLGSTCYQDQNVHKFNLLLYNYLRIYLSNLAIVSFVLLTLLGYVAWPILCNRFVTFKKYNGDHIGGNLNKGTNISLSSENLFRNFVHVAAIFDEVLVLNIFGWRFHSRACEITVYSVNDNRVSMRRRMETKLLGLSCDHRSHTSPIMTYCNVFNWSLAFLIGRKFI